MKTTWRRRPVTPAAATVLNLNLLTDIVGQPITLDADKTYVLQVDHEISYEEAVRIKEAWIKASRAQCVVISPSVHLTVDVTT